MTGTTDLALWAITGTFVVISLALLVPIARLMLRGSPRAATATIESAPSKFGRAVIPAVLIAIVALPAIRLVYIQSSIPAADLTIRLTGNLWYWSNEYPDYDKFSFNARMVNESVPGQTIDFRTPGIALGGENHLVVPVGEKIRFLAAATSVIYSWNIPAVGIDVTALPGRDGQAVFTANKEGHYYGEAVVLCGLPHIFKPVELEVVSRERFDQWIAQGRKAGLASIAVPSDQRTD